MIQFDAASIKARLQNRLKAKTSWAHILFFSTNQRLIDIIAEEIAYDMQYDEKLTIESKWTLAQQRSSLLSENQFFDYYPYRKIGSSGFLKVSSDEAFNKSYAKNIEIKKFDTFSSGDITFCASTSISLLSNELSTQVPIVQGTPKVETFLAKGDIFESFTINNDSIENSLIDVYVNNELVTVYNNIREAETPTILACTIRNLNDMSGIEIRFGNDYYAKKLKAGDLVRVNYVETLGSFGNIDSSNIITTVVSTIYDTDGNSVDLYCTNESSIIGGSEYEDLEDIRAKAPKTYQTGKRAISNEDYKSILESFPFVKKATSWGEAEVNEDLNNLPGTYIPLEENVVHVSAVSSTDTNLTDTQIALIRDELNDKKPPTDIVVFENVSFIYMSFLVNAYVSNKQYTLTYVSNNILQLLQDSYAIQNLTFKNPIRFSDYTSLIDGAEGVSYHESIIKYYKFERFNLAYSADIKIEMENITPSTLKVFVKDLTDISSIFIQVGHDNGSGAIIADAGYTLSNSSITYATGIGSIVITSGLSSPYSNYQIKVEFQTNSTSVLPTKRYQFISYGDSTITAQYE